MRSLGTSRRRSAGGNSALRRRFAGRRRRKVERNPRRRRLVLGGKPISSPPGAAGSEENRWGWAAASRTALEHRLEVSVASARRTGVDEQAGEEARRILAIEERGKPFYTVNKCAGPPPLPPPRPVLAAAEVMVG